jgi:hypothetical protein
MDPSNDQFKDMFKNFVAVHEDVAEKTFLCMLFHFRFPSIVLLTALSVASGSADSSISFSVSQFSSIKEEDELHVISRDGGFYPVRWACPIERTVGHQSGS